jgi:hypothetical protein
VLSKIGLRRSPLMGSKASGPSSPQATAADVEFLKRFLDADPALQKRTLARLVAYQRACREEQQQRPSAADKQSAYRRQERNENKVLWMLRQAIRRPCQGRSREARSGPARSRGSGRSSQRARSPDGDDPPHLDPAELAELSAPERGAIYKSRDLGVLEIASVEEAVRLVLRRRSRRAGP